ncbi:GLUTAMINE DUMPER 3 [Spatholobus suberectus]|nr:GLUTAMINE DUMPER 3 [Spatholobus suberectus]
MALVAFALLMLACSYWSLARTQHSENNNNNNVVKEGDDDPRNKEHPKVYEEEILVIMAGDHKPTFLATPSCPNNYSSSFAHGACNHFDKHLEDCDRSQKEITDNHVVVTDATKESGSSQPEQRSR